MIAGGEQRALSRLRKIQEGGLGGTDFGSKIISATLGDFVVGLEEWLKTPVPARRGGISHSMLGVLSPELTCCIAIRVILDSLGTHSTANKVAFAIAKNLEIEIASQSLTKRALRYAKKMHPSIANLVKAAKSTESGISIPEYEDSVRASAGMALLMIFQDATGLVDLQVIRTSPSRTPRIVIPSEALVDWINEAVAKKAFTLPMYGPMDEPPKEWTTPFDGGYTSLRRRGIIKGECPTFNAESPWVRAVNRLQQVKWVINTTLLDELIFLMPDKIAQKKLGLWVDVEMKLTESKLRNSVLRYRDVMGRQQKYEEQRLLAVATAHRHDPFYYPWFCDFRGRMYPIPGGLQPQGRDLAKALLQFANEEPVDVKEWFAYGDRLLKSDSKSFFDAWDGTVHSIPDGLSDPIRTFTWLLETKLMTSSGRWRSGVVVSIDGRCNGLQMISLLSGDSVLAEMTNVSGDNGDIYNSVGDEVLRMLALSDDMDLKFWITFFKAKIPRDLSKKIVMVIPYGVTTHTIRKIITDYYDSVLWEPGRSKSQRVSIKQSILKLSKTYFEAIKSLAPTCCNSLTWFRKAGKILSEAPITWVSPSQFPVKMIYFKSSKKMIETYMYGRMTKHSVRVEGDISTRSMGATFLPNFVHSLDASVAHLAALNFHGPLVTVHDSFGTTSNRIAELKRALKSVVYSVFSTSPLQQFSSRVPIPDFQQIQIGNNMYE